MTHGDAAAYVGALADGELDLVPTEVRDHVAGCPDCAREVAWQHEVNTALAAALGGEVSGGPGAHLQQLSAPWWNRLPMSRVLAGAAAAVVVLAATGLLLARPPGNPHPRSPVAEDVLSAASRAYGAAPTMATSDPGAATAWSAAHGLGSMTAPSVAGATLMGVRGEAMAGTPSVTFLYADPSGQVEVTALTTPVPPDWPMSETRVLGGRAVGMMGHANQRMVVVAPDEAALTRVMSSIQ